MYFEICVESAFQFRIVCKSFPSKGGSLFSIIKVLQWVLVLGFRMFTGFCCVSPEDEKTLIYLFFFISHAAFCIFN